MINLLIIKQIFYTVLFIFSMAWFQVMRMKYDNAIEKYKIPQKIGKMMSSQYIRVFAWVFICTRLLRIYQLVF
jgi:hypothetical protein